MHSVTIVIPVLFLNNYARQAMLNLGKVCVNSKIEFLFAVSSQNVGDELKQLLGKFNPKHRIIVTNNKSSNFLRSQATLATTDFVFFHDCDDSADFEAITLELEKDLDLNVVHCYPINKLFLSESGDIIKNKIIMKYTEDKVITDIRFVPTYVYSKLIPTKLLKNVQFPNLPYSQDWAISYSLYNIAPHVQHTLPLYNYYNYPTSSSSAKHTTRHGTNRVNVFSKQLLQLFRNRTYEYEFLQFRYLVLLNERYHCCGIKYFNKSVSPRKIIFKHPFSRLSLSIIYQYFMITKKLFLKNID